MQKVEDICADFGFQITEGDVDGLMERPSGNDTAAVQARDKWCVYSYATSIGASQKALYTDEGLGTRGNLAPGCLEPKRNADISQV
jgi:hypothetical protein